MTEFKDMELREDILRAVFELGFEKPTGIQEKVIPEILEGKGDIIGLAQTGTGKTAGFGLPIIQETDVNTKAVQCIILCPTRELCLQICKDFKQYSKYVKGFKTLAIYGGASISTQINGLKSNPQVIVGTPGRTLDMIKRRKLSLTHIRQLVLDEADEMLNMGFREDLDAILKDTPKEKQTLLFSATMPSGVRQLTKKYMDNPVEIVIGKKNTGTADVEHEVYTVRAADRYLTLKRLLDINPGIYGIVFCRTRAETRDVAQKLIEDGYPADAIHGDLSQAQRDQVMHAFRNHSIQMLVATDVAARGLDIHDLTHIVNYNLPDELEMYIHRSGRTGRAGKKGKSLIISHSREGRKIQSLEKITGQKIVRKSVPRGEDIVQKRLYTLMDNIEKIVVDEEKIAPYWEEIKQKLDWLDRDELLKRLIFLEFNRFVEYYKNAKDLNAPEKENKPKRKNKERKNKERPNGKEIYKKSPVAESGFTRFFINIGEKQNIKVHNLIGLINENTRNRNIEIGKIDIMRKFSFFEVEEAFTTQVLNAFNDTYYHDTKLVVEISKPDNKVKARPEKEHAYKKEHTYKKKKGSKQRKRQRR
ncbi:MAG: DEAD/DEAH box helicase [Candidatus Delongbacteria bacterium]|jgi:ATP-dependent RNA helicase DeaD|nr:DEAD/DEAH box helicase [Candidatus Delongbacteria bacterium]